MERREHVPRAVQRRPQPAQGQRQPKQSGGLLGLRQQQPVGDDVHVAGGGTIYRWNGSEWRRTDTGDATLRDVEVVDDHGCTVGGGGTAFGYDGSEWTACGTPTGENLKAVARGDTTIAVGASGTVLEI